MRNIVRYMSLALVSMGLLHCGDVQRWVAAPTPYAAAGGNATLDTSCVAPTPLLRLSRAQYVTSIQDIFGVTLPALDLPQDDAAGPFAANYATSVTDLSVAQYQAASLSVADVVAGQMQHVLPCDAAAMNGNCAALLVTQLGQRAFRRDLTATEQAQYEAIVAPYALAGDANNTVRVLTEAFLQSPHFLYRVEVGIGTTNANVRVLSSFELATRMAYLLWGSAPDTRLLASAHGNLLLDSAALAQEANRLLDDPRFAVQMTRFFQELLALDALDSATKDPNIYPSFDANLRAAMAQETGSFVSYVMLQGDGRLETMLTAPYSVVPAPLSGLYGTAASADPNDLVSFDPRQRAGLLTQAAFLAGHAHGNAQPAVVLRGKVVRENLLCQSMPAPPPNVMPLPEVAQANATARQIFANHESNPSCAGCHTLMDPIGLSFEPFDGIGAYRTQEGISTIDPSGYISGSLHSNATFANVVDLSHILALSDDVHTCVVTQALRFGLSRQLTSVDACTVAQLRVDFDASSHNLRDLMFHIVTSPSFRTLGVSQ